MFTCTATLIYIQLNNCKITHLRKSWWFAVSELVLQIETDSSISATDGVTGEWPLSLKVVSSSYSEGASHQGFRQGICIFFWQYLPYMPPLCVPARCTRALYLSGPRGICSAYSLGGWALLGMLWGLEVRLIHEKGGCGVRNMGLPQLSSVVKGRQAMRPDLK